MNGAIFYATRYGSTADYAGWIAKETGLDAFDIATGNGNLADYDFVVLGSPVIYHKLVFWKWVRANLDALAVRPVILFTVSGAPAGAKLTRWIADSLPPDLVRRMPHFALQGRQNPRDLTLFDRIMLILGSLRNPDRQAAREEMQGFDFMDRDSIRPVVEAIEALRRGGNLNTPKPKARAAAH